MAVPTQVGICMHHMHNSLYLKHVFNMYITDIFYTNQIKLLCILYTHFMHLRHLENSFAPKLFLFSYTIFITLQFKASSECSNGIKTNISRPVSFSLYCKQNNFALIVDTGKYFESINLPFDL